MVNLLADIVISIILLFFLLFTGISIWEREKRAALRAFVASLAFLSLLIVKKLLPLSLQQLLSWFVLLVLLAFVLLSLFYRPSKPSLIIRPSRERFDERDVIFARADYRPGTLQYEQYYSQHPEKKELDDWIRSFPDLCEKGGLFFNRLNSPICTAEFDFLERLLELVDGEVATERVELDPAEATKRLKGLALYLGADLVGVAKLEERYFYSHVGRGPEPWGSPIEVKHRFGLVFALEMDWNMVSCAPRSPTVIETGKQYVRAAVISIIIANYIRSLGYSARAHIAGSNYQVILPAIAYQAGLGELGRIGILVTEQFGPRVRLGLVTTDLPLIPDGPRSFGLMDFCEFCRKCAEVCPSRAIPLGPKEEVRGVVKWQLDYEKCYIYWRKIGTDCGLCLYSCPYSKPANFFHNLIRKYASLSHFARRVCLLADNIFYGRRPVRKKEPGWMRT